jgi:hypothetical protein
LSQNVHKTEIVKQKILKLTFVLKKDAMWKTIEDGNGLRILLGSTTATTTDLGNWLNLKMVLFLE